ncbi:MAG TPA: FtsX-like permease family protein [Streptosporangiaceae bacterium]
MPSLAAGPAGPAVRERPAPGGAAGGDGGGPARRAVIRWAWRLFRREWRQQLMILGLITVAVAGTVLGAAVATTTPPSPSAATFGTANHLVTIPGRDPHLAADVAAIRDRFGPADVIENTNLVTGSAATIQLRAQDPAGPYGQPTLALDSGHYPAGPGEVALTRQVASLYDLRVGGIWHQGGQARRVTGIVENPSNLGDEFALVAPGQIGAPAQVTVLFDVAPGRAAGFRFPAGATVQTPAPPTGGISPALIVLAAALLGLTFIGLVAVAGFTVVARRRLRALGMLGALGAADRNVRLVMTANGAIVGGAGTLAGAVAGFAAWLAYRPHLEVSAGHRIDALHLPWWLIGTGMALAVVTSTLAARRPARAIARMSVSTALAGRPEQPKPARRSAVPGALLLITGPVLLALSGGWGNNSGAAALESLGGLAATIFGGLLLAPFCIAGLAKAAANAPLAVRLALRDLARYRSRSAAALSAISFAVVLAVLVCILAGARYANALDYTGPNLAANQLIVYAPGMVEYAPGGGASPAAATPHGGAGTLPARVGSLAASLHASYLLALDSATRPGNGQPPATLSQVGTVTNNYTGPLYVATPALLRQYHIGPGQIRAATDILTMRPGLAAEQRMQLAYPEAGPPGPGPAPGRFPYFCPAGSCLANPKMQTISSLPAGTSAPNTVITMHALRALGLRPVLAGWLIQTPRPLTAAQINAARQLAVAAGTSVETKSGQASLAEILDDATAVGVLIALGVLAMTVGLIRSETASDLRTLAATGAGPTTRRNLTAATAGALGLLGALIGTGIAYLTTASWFHPVAVIARTAPSAELLVILAGLPLAAAAGGWLFAGRQPPVIARQPLE